MASGLEGLSSGSSVMFTPDAPGLVEHWTTSVAFTPFDVKWIPESARFVLLGSRPNDTGIIQVYELGAGDDKTPKLVKTIDRPAGIKCGTFDESSIQDRHLACGDFAGSLTVIDLENASKPVFSAPEAHGSIVNAIDGCGGTTGGGAAEIATGSRDGSVRVWDSRVSDPVLNLLPTEGQPTKPPEVWAVAFGNSFNDDDRVLAAGYDNGDVKLFDMRAGRMQWEGNAGAGVVSAQFDRKDIEMNKLVVTTMDSRFRVYDLRTQHPTEGFAHVSERAHKATVWTARHLPQNRDVFVTTGGNGGVNIYKYGYPEKRAVKDDEGRMRGVAGRCELLNARMVSTQPVIAWDWSPTREGLACAACLDQTVRVYTVTKLERHNR